MEENNGALNIITRYTTLILLSLKNFWIFYLILTPLTIYLSSMIFNFFVGAAVISQTIFLEDGLKIEIIEACVAGPAYYLLAILNLSTAGIRLSKRFILAFTTFSLFLVFNILRIVVLGLLYYHEFAHFDLLHKALWYFMSIFLVIIVWFVNVNYFGIKELPFYSDIKYLYNSIKSND